MARRGILDRYDGLEARADRLAGEPPAGASPVHVQCIKVLTDLMGMASSLSSSGVPPAVRAAMRTLDRLSPSMLENIADVPPEKIVEFMREMQGRLESIIAAHVPTLDEVSNDAGTGGPQPDRAPTH